MKAAFKMPIIVSAKVYLKCTRGTVELRGVCSRGIVRIGFGNVGIFDERISRTIWEMNGKIIFEGSAMIGHGSKISVGEKGTLIIGNNFIMTAESTIVCNCRISIEDDCLFSWEVLVIDTDYHALLDSDGVRINIDREIRIGARNWIGCRTLILKGTSTSNDCVIGSYSLLNKDFVDSFSLIAGNPARIIKKIGGWTP